MVECPRTTGRLDARAVALAWALGLGVLLRPCVLAAEEDALQARVREVIAKATPSFVFIGGGSGVIITPDGEFLTNQHVALSSTRWEVRLADGRIVTARRLGRDPYGDVALLKIEGATDLPFVPLGDSDALETGEIVVALGNPYGLGGTLESKASDPAACVGIVSALHRRQGTYTDAIQTDAPINPGNSGGPLLNLRGELVGINGRIATRFNNRVNSGIGFAIPSHQVRRFLPALRRGGTVFHGMIEGLTVARRHLPDGGARVDGVTPGTSAARAGFRIGDAVVRMDRYPTPTWSRFGAVTASYPEGADLDVWVRRDGKEQALRVRLDRLRDFEEEIAFLQRSAPVEAGVRVDDAPAGGVLLVEVESGSPAASAGLKSEDVLTRLNGHTVTSRLDYFLILRWIRPGQAAPVEASRGAERVSVTVTFRKRTPEPEETEEEGENLEERPGEGERGGDEE